MTDRRVAPTSRGDTKGSAGHVNVIVFGASGNVGGHLVRLAAERGHRVTAVVRRETPYEPPRGVALVRGDVLDGAFVAGVVPGHDAVTSCVGMRYAHPWAKRRSPDDLVERATKNLVAAMRAAGVRRISIVSAAGVGDSRPGLNLPMRVMLAISNVGAAYADLERAEAVLRESGLDWQAVRPTTLTHGPRTDRVRIADRFATTARISREDVAAFLLRELERPAFSARTPLVTGG